MYHFGILLRRRLYGHKFRPPRFYPHERGLQKGTGQNGRRQRPEPLRAGAYRRRPRYQEILYPEASLRFIAILDNVDTQSENSNEFAAFTNLFNEWYPKTTSKKVKQVKCSKAMNGEHLGAAPFGYLKNPDNPKRWLVDEKAAAIVRRIFQMALDGFGCSAIATALWRDKVLTPSAYKASKGIGVSRYSEDPYCWESSAVSAILDNSAYIGVTEGLKSLRLSFKSKKRVPSPKGAACRRRGRSRADHRQTDLGQGAVFAGKQVPPHQNGSNQYLFGTALLCRLRCKDLAERIERVQVFPLRRVQAKQPDECLQHPLYPESALE